MHGKFQELDPPGEGGSQTQQEKTLLKKAGSATGMLDKTQTPLGECCEGKMPQAETEPKARGEREERGPSGSNREKPVSIAEI